MSRGFWILTLIGLAALAGALFGAWARRVRDRLRWARLRRRGRSGEARAPKVLAAAGYEVLAEQPEQSFPLLVDGAPQPVTLRADGLARRRRDGRLFVVEIKTGQKAPSPVHAATRRQLLEYRLAYPVQGALLVDMERGVVHEVAWPNLSLPPADAAQRPQPWRAWAKPLLLGALLGAAVTLLLLRR